MFLNKLILLNFKNHPSLSLNFTRKINCFIGKNGVGKTNIIDAIYYLCLTKSYFNNVDQQNILFGKDFFRLDGQFVKHTWSRNGDPVVTEMAEGYVSESDPINRIPLSIPNSAVPANGPSEKIFEVVYKLPLNKRKELIVNDSPLPKLSDHIGNFPCIIISPDDSQLILGSSEERRKFLDGTISQVNHEYLEWLIAYGKVLSQRNAALKRFAETKKTDTHLLESYNRQLIPLGSNIYNARKLVIERLKPIFQSFYKQISLEREMVSFTYYSQLNERPFGELLHDNLQKDIYLQRTDVGIHKDDMEFFIVPVSTLSGNRDSGITGTGSNAPLNGFAGNAPVSNGKTADGSENTGRASRMKKFGSQGQQKSFIISMKFAQYELIKQSAQHKPLLLIDDIFDKLDDDRSQKLIELIAGDGFGQIFLTDTGDAHICETLQGREELFEVVEV